MALTTPGGRALGLRLDVPPDRRNWAFPMAPLRTPPPSVIDLRPGSPYGIQDQGSIGACHDAETEVLTDRGFKLFSALDGSERLATVDPATAALTYEVPTRLVRYPYRGPLYCAANASVNFRVTPNHNMLVRRWDARARALRPSYDFVEAQRVGWYTGLLNRVRWDGEAHSDTYTLPGVPDHFTARREPRDVPMAAWLRFLGIYLAEGTLLKRTERRGQVGYKIQLAASKPREKAFIRETLAALGLHALELRDRFTFSNHQVYEALSALGLEGVKAGQKFVPAFVFRQSAVMIQAFLAGHFAGDGGMAGEQRVHWTGSALLADGLQTLIFLSGQETRVSIRAGRTHMTADGRTITGSLPEHRVSVCERKNLSLERRESLHTEDYDGEVFCAEVPTHHTLVTRRAGTILISGNCTAFAGTRCLEWLLNNSDSPGSVTKLSELFTYYINRKTDGSPTSQDTGASSQSIAKGMMAWGAAAEGLQPYDVSRFTQAPSQAAYADALGRKILRYYQIQGDLLGGLWACLSAGIPFLMGFQVPQSFETGVGADGHVPAPGAHESILGGHEMMGCMWVPDSTAPGGIGYVGFANSWSDRMGMGGYYLIPTSYWDAGLVMDHMVLAFDSAPPPHPIPTPPDPATDKREEMRGICTEVKRIITSAQVTGWSDPSVQSALGACSDYQEQLKTLVESTPLSYNDQGTVKDYATECQAIIARAQKSGWSSVGTRSQLGSIKDYQDDILALVNGPAPPSPDPTPPSPPRLGGWGGSYHYPGADHDPAKDLYLGRTPEEREWGEHWGHAVLAPASGTVTAYTFPTPLNLKTGLLGAAETTTLMEVDAYLRNHADLFREALQPGACYYGAQTMYFALLTFDTPQMLSNGRSVKAIWIGHCKGDIAVGRVNAGDRWCTVWDSGIHFEANGINARASHAHTCGTYSGALTMNGEVNGFLVAELLGWDVEDRGIVPGPNEYLAGGYIAGKAKALWAGHPVPAMPS